MKNKLFKKIVTGLFCVSLMMSALTGCNNEDNKVYVDINKEVHEDELALHQENAAEAEETLKQLEENSNILQLEIGFVNKLGVEIGMISLIDPVTHEQVNVSGLADGEVLSVTSSFPKDVKELEWAIYNINGELYCENTTDISQATQSVYIFLRGDKRIEDIDAQFDKTKEELEKLAE